MTSANVTYYRLYFIDGNEIIHEFRQHCLCKSNVKDNLANVDDPHKYELELMWPDENEAPHYSKRIPLTDYLDGKKVEWYSYDERY